MVNKLTSLIMPVRDCSSTISGVLDSVIELARLTPIQLIIIDDGSNDDTLAVIDRSKKNMRHGDIEVYVNGSSLGPGQCRNDALERARGEIVGFIDGDDRMFPEAYSRAIEQAQNSECELLLFDDINGVYDRHRVHQLEDKIRRRELLRKVQLNGSVIYSLFDKKFIDRNSLSFGASYFEDIQFQYAALSRADKIYISDECAYQKINTRNSIMNSFSHRHVAGVLGVLSWMDRNLVADEFLPESQTKAEIAWGVRGLLYQMIFQAQDDESRRDRFRAFISAGLDVDRIMSNLTSSPKDKSLGQLLRNLNEVV